MPLVNGVLAQKIPVQNAFATLTQSCDGSKVRDMQPNAGQTGDAGRVAIDNAVGGRIGKERPQEHVG
jgi:hypothetical protein